MTSNESWLQCNVQKYKREDSVDTAVHRIQWTLHPDARAIGFHTKHFKKSDTKTKKGPPDCFLQALLLLKWIDMINSNPMKE